jgi:hypothetical protein
MSVAHREMMYLHIMHMQPVIHACGNECTVRTRLMRRCVRHVPLCPFAFSQPLFLRLDTATHFQFRIRNLPYEYDNYILTIEEATQEILLRTKNKKSLTQRHRAANACAALTSVRR